MQRGVRPAIGAWQALPGYLSALRVTELGIGLRENPVPALVATPTDRLGGIDPAVLVARIEAAEEQGWQPWPLDLDQALLRLPRDPGPGLVARAGRLRSPAGIRLAAWLSAPPADPVLTRRADGHGPVSAGQEDLSPGGRRRVALTLGRTPRSALHGLLFQPDPGEPPDGGPVQAETTTRVPELMVPAYPEAPGRDDVLNP